MKSGGQGKNPHKISDQQCHYRNPTEARKKHPDTGKMHDQHWGLC
jgi:hypothetical protein